MKGEWELKVKTWEGRTGTGRQNISYTDSGICYQLSFNEFLAQKGGRNFHFLECLCRCFYFFNPFLGLTHSVIFPLANSFLPRINHPILYLSPGHTPITSHKHYFNYFPGNIYLLYYSGCSLRNISYFSFVFPYNECIAFIQHYYASGTLLNLFMQYCIYSSGKTCEIGLFMPYHSFSKHLFCTTHCVRHCSKSGSNLALCLFM